MKRHIIEFVPPIEGIDVEFNTVRLGLTWAKRLAVNDVVYLSNNKERQVIGEAVVLAIYTGSLGEICESHGKLNHTQLKDGLPDSPARLLGVIQKLYGPHIATINKKATVIYLRPTLY